MSNKEEFNEKKKILEDEEKNRKNFAKEMKKIIQLFSPDNIPIINKSTYDREKLRRYLKNPANETNNKNLRKLSNYLYTISNVYKRMVNYKAEQVNCKIWDVYPIINMSEEVDRDSILKEYSRVVNIMLNMNMESQILKMMKELWKNGVTYGYIYGDPEKEGSFYIHLLDPDFCKINCVSYYSGVLGFLFDFSYFNGSEYKLDFYDKEFKKLYNEYKRDNISWKQLPIEKTICFKIDTDNLDYSIPPMSGLLESIISITDLQSAQDEIDGLQNYKMVWGKLETLNGSNVSDDFSVDLDLALEFMKKINEVLPENVAYALSPLDLKTIEFKDNNASDTNVLSKAYSNLIEANGSIVLNSNKITNSTAFKLAVMVEAIDSTSIVPQINAWLKFYLRTNHNVENMIAEYSDISPYFLDENIEKYTKLAGLGLPVKLQLASMLNSNPQKSYGMDYVERELLKIGIDRWTNPLISSNVQSSSDSSNKKDDSELTDEGVETRDKDKNDK